MYRACVMTNHDFLVLGSALPAWRRASAVLAGAAFALVLFFSGRADASSFVFKTPEATESNGLWHLKVRIDLSRPPAMMHTPMRFTFSKLAVDERAIMTKGAQPEHHRMVLDTQPKQIVSMDVDFADPSGKVFKSTYFEFDVERASGYFEAGEYTVMLSGTDGDIGGAQKLVLKGDNPPVYRGAMDFTADAKASKKKGPNIQAVSSGLDAGSGNSDDAPVAAAHSTEVQASGSAPSMVPESAYNKTPEEEGVQDHPKGCGCVAAGADTSPFAGGAALLLLGLALVARRRSS
jgi:MYXO-CTERM domain-containing protein